MAEEAPVVQQEKEFRRTMRLRRILLPVLLGLVAAVWLLYRDLGRERYEEAPHGNGDHTWVDANHNHLPDLGDPAEFKPVEPGTGHYRRITAREALGSIDWTWHSTVWFILALIATVLRDVGYMIRIRLLTDKQLSWRSSFNSIMLWEFASALTPSVVGGSGIAVFILDREGIPLGRSTAVVLVTAMLDEIFYLVAVPLLFLFVGMDNLFPAQLDLAFWGLPIKTIFWVGYLFIAAMTATVFYAIFFRPRAFKFLLLHIFRLRFLRRWRPAVVKVGDDIVTASTEMRGRDRTFWSKAFITTSLSWGSRFLVINFLAAALFSVSDHLLLYTRQLIMWVILLISPTPGSSGVAELAFAGFFRDLLPTAGFIGAVAILWRILTYYLYLFVGAITLPRWLRRTARH
ncbi:MAG: flippase-like domain-containing protein [Flavobacteriales bacterium]|nr:flippase-like domain-containing protein [Flavobacteriales bacterium]